MLLKRVSTHPKEPSSRYLLSIPFVYSSLEVPKSQKNPYAKLKIQIIERKIVVGD